MFRKSVEHIEWLTTNTPNRLSGGGQDLKASRIYMQDNGVLWFGIKHFGLRSI